MAFLTDVFTNTGFISAFVVILPALFAIYITLWIVYCRTLHPLAKVPGPFFASFTRLWYMYRIYAADMDRVQRALHKKYGPLIRIAPDEVSSADPAAIPLIYRDRDPLLKTDFYTIWGDPSISKHPDMFTCIDEKYHADIRRIVSPVYTMANILKNEEYIARCTRLFVRRLGEFADREEPFDLGVWVQYYTFDTVGELMFGKMFGFLEKGEDHGNFIRSLETLLPLIVTGAVAPAYARPFIMGSGIFVPAALRAIKALGNIRNAALGAVSNRKKEVEDGIADRYDLLQQMLDIARDKGEKADYGENEVACHCWSNLFAGSDTTATAIRACFYFLVKNPDMMRKVQSELDAAFPSVSSPIKYSDVIKLPYLCAVIRESMRLFNGVGLGLPRMSPAGGIELSGMRIQQGYRIGISNQVVTYDESTFGSDASEFRPQRWLVSEEKVRALERATALQFGAGTRTCTGKNIALTEIYTAVPEVLLNFDIEIVGDWKIVSRWFHKQTNFITILKRRRAP